MLGEGTTDNIGSGGTVEQKFSINITNTRAKCCLSLHYNGDNSYLLIKNIYKPKADEKNVKFPTQFCFGSISENLVLMPSQKKHHLKEIFMVFQLIKMLPEF